MKIICVGRNYVDHIKELNNEFPVDPIIFFKPESSLLKSNKFLYPSFSTEIHHEIELVYEISKKGKNIDEIDAFNYISKVGLGIDFTARDIQSHNKKNGLPWGFSKSFDGSAAVSKLINANRINDFNDINFLLKKNNVLVQEGNSNLMIYKIDFLISYISNFITLEKGDLIFSGTPKGVSKINIGDKLDGYHENEKTLSINIS